MILAIGIPFPDFKAKTTVGDIQFYDWLDKSWCLLFSMSKDRGGTCTSELMGIADLLPELQRRDVKPLGLACDYPEVNQQWLNTITNASGGKMAHFPFPIIADPDRRLSCLWGILDSDTRDDEQIPLAARAVLMVDPNHILRLMMIYPAKTGYSLVEILRTIESLQQTDRKKAESKAHPGLPPPVDVFPKETSNSKFASIFPNDSFSYLSH